MLVRGEGPSDAQLAIFGEAPGKEEHFRGRPFVGKTGKLLTPYLRKVGIRREDCWVDNLVPIWPGLGNPDPSEADVLKWTPRMMETIALLKPRVVCTLGRFSTRVLLPEHLKHLSMDHLSGLVFKHPAGFLHIPIYHPAYGLHEPRFSARCFAGFRQLGKLMKGEVRLWERSTSPGCDCHIPSPGVIAYNAAVDTEGSVSRPECLSYSIGQGGRVVLAKHLQKGHAFIGRTRLHYALADLPVLRQMGVQVGEVDDTGELAYLLDEPGSLKTLAFRHLHRVRREYEEVVRPYHTAAVLKYLARAKRKKWPKPEERLQFDPKTGKQRFYKPQGMDQRIKSVCTSIEKGTAPKLEQWWDGLMPELREPVVEKLGEFPRLTLDLVPDKEATDYAGGDAQDTHDLFPLLYKRVEEEELTRPYKIDMAVIPMADRMMQVGIGLDTDKLAVVDKEFRARRAKLDERIRSLAGLTKAFNPASPQQVAKLLFNQLRLPSFKLTAGGQQSTQDRVLQTLHASPALRKNERAREIVRAIIDRRSLDTNIKTFTGPLPSYIGKDGRIHGTIKPYTTGTGRWSMEEPNLQNIPVRSDDGKRIREAFIAAHDRLFISVDLSQIELRMMAHLSRDKRMMQAFLHDEDLHALTASLLFGVKLKDVTKEQRYVAKTINFAIMYGISARALHEQLVASGIYQYSEDDCERIRGEWFKVYAAVHDYLEEVYAECRRFGFVRDFVGRKRRLPNVWSDDPGTRAAAEREAGNHPIQGGAQEIEKIGMAKVWEEVEWSWKASRFCQPILQIHDELIVECAAKIAKQVGEQIRLIMGSVVKLRVPVKVSMSIADNWGGLK